MYHSGELETPLQMEIMLYIPFGKLYKDDFLFIFLFQKFISLNSGWGWILRGKCCQRERECHKKFEKSTFFKSIIKYKHITFIWTKTVKNRGHNCTGQILYINRTTVVKHDCMNSMISDIINIVLFSKNIYLKLVLTFLFLSVEKNVSTLCFTFFKFKVGLATDSFLGNI